MENNDTTNPPVRGGGVNLQEERDAALSSAGVQAAVPEYEEKARERELYRQSDNRRAAAVTAVGLPVATEEDARLALESSQQASPAAAKAGNSASTEKAAAAGKSGSSIEELEQMVVEQLVVPKAVQTSSMAKAGTGKTGSSIQDLEQMALTKATLGRAEKISGAVNRLDKSVIQSSGGKVLNASEFDMLMTAAQSTPNQSVPGAFAFSNPIGARNAPEDPETETVEEMGEETAPHDSGENTPSFAVHVPGGPDDTTKSGLVEAKPVIDDEEQGIVMGTQLDNEERKKKDENFRAWTIRFLLLLCLVLVVVVVTAVAVANNDDDGGPSGTIAPTQGTTMSPTPAPTAYAVSLPPYTLEALEDPESPQSMAYQWLRNDAGLQGYSEKKRLQRFALATFFYATMGSDWRINTSWMSYDVEECDWYSNFDVGTESEGFQFESLISQSLPNGTQCDEEGNYLQLVLSANGLAGTLPKEIALLSRLRRIDLASTGIMGSLPTEFGLLSSLEILGFLGMALEGTLPVELGNMTAMKELEIAQNFAITGTIPSELQYMTNLSFLSLDGCSLSGSISSTIGLLTELKYLSLSSNPLSGTVPTELGLLRKLSLLGLYVNEMTGSIPTELGHLSEMETFILSNTFITGTIPSELALMTDLARLALGESFLTGTIPNGLWTLPKTRALDLSSIDGLQGSIPTEIGLSTSLSELYVDGSSEYGSFGFGSFGRNDFWGGSIPSEIGLLSNLQRFWFHEANISGTLPSELGLLTNMLELRCEGNPLLTGPIPFETANNQSRLYWLTTRNTSLTGTIPDSVCDNDPIFDFDCPSVCGCDCQCESGTNVTSRI